MSSISANSLALRMPRIGSSDDPDLMLSALTEEDLPLLRRWFAEPHVASVWSPPGEGIEEIASHLSRAHVAPYLIVEAGRPVGYLQLYHANPDDFWMAHDLPRDTYGLDLFIGPPDALRRGLGARAILLAVRHLAALPGCARLHIDPAPDNGRAIHVYEKAGFRKVGEIETPDGRCVYMILDPKDVILDRARTREIR
jgi:aminoglycoside 6'-N-acetyltransferase